MAMQQYYGHTVEGAALFLGEERWRASGRVSQNGAVLVQSCNIGFFRTCERAMAEGIKRDLKYAHGPQIMAGTQ